MSDDVLMKMLLDRLSNMETKSESRDVRIHERMDSVKDANTKTEHTLTKMETDIVEIKKDLFEHKEGVIQNRGEIAKQAVLISELTIATEDQEIAIKDSVALYKSEVAPVITHIADMQALPGKIKGWIISSSKVLAALVVILSSFGALAGYFAGWF